jgi:PAS domain S-box-containing protein
MEPGWVGPIQATFRVQDAAGAWRWREARGVRVRDDDGTHRSVLVLRDIHDRKRAEEALLQSEGRATALLAAIPDLMFRMTREGEYLDFKAERREDLYVAPERIIGGNIRDLLPGHIAQPVLALIERALDDGGVQTLEYALPKMGQEHEYEARITRSGEDEVVVICRAVTERNRAESALRESERRFRELADGAPFVIYMTDENFRTVFVNRAMLNFTGRTFEEQLAVPLGVNRHPEDARRLREVSRAGIARRERFTSEQRFRNAAGEYRWLITDAQPRLDHNGNYAGYIGYSIDVTDRRDVERRAQEAADREGVLRERQRIAQELHDSVAQYFFSIGMAANAAIARDGSTAEELRDRVAGIRALSVEGGQQIREAIQALGEAPSADVDAAIQALFGQLRSEAIDVRYARIGEKGPLSDGLQRELLSIVRECLFNVRKHANAARVRVTLTTDERAVTLTVADDGAGDAATIARAVRQRGGYGLRSMRARVRVLGGSVTWQDNDGAGVRVTAVLPHLEGK